MEEQGPHQELCLQVSTLPFSSRFSCHDTVSIPEISPAVNDSGAASASPFFGRLKNEMFYGCEKGYNSFDAFSVAIKSYIDYYNNERIQAKTNWMPPSKFRVASMS